MGSAFVVQTVLLARQDWRDIIDYAERRLALDGVADEDDAEGLLFKIALRDETGSVRSSVRSSQRGAWGAAIDVPFDFSQQRARAFSLSGYSVVSDYTYSYTLDSQHERRASLSFAPVLSPIPLIPKPQPSTLNPQPPALDPRPLVFVNGEMLLTTARYRMEWISVDLLAWAV